VTEVNAEIYCALRDAGTGAENAQAFAATTKDTPPLPVLLIPSLSLRDLFAAVALHALLTTPMRHLAVETAYEGGRRDAEGASVWREGRTMSDLDAPATKRDVRSLRLIVFVALACTGTADADEIAAILDQASPAVVTVLTETRQGSGFVIRADGIVVTTWHVIAGASRVRVRLSSGQLLAVTRIVAANPDRDVAMMHVAGTGLPIVRLGDTATVRRGDRILVIGSPLGLEQTVSDGLISAIRHRPDPVLQVTAPISPGSSVGPVLNAQGLVVGVAVFRLRGGKNLNFAGAGRGGHGSGGPVRPVAVHGAGPGGTPRVGPSSGAGYPGPSGSGALEPIPAALALVGHGPGLAGPGAAAPGAQHHRRVSGRVTHAARVYAKQHGGL
jgi:hypothetical protein